MTTSLELNSLTKDYFIDRAYFTPEMLFKSKNLPLRPNTLIDLTMINPYVLSDITLKELWLSVKDKYISYEIKLEDIDFTLDGHMVIVIRNEKNKKEIDYVVKLSLSHYHQNSKLSLNVCGVYEVVKNIIPKNEVLISEESDYLISEVKKFLTKKDIEKTPTIKTSINCIKYKDVEIKLNNLLFVVGFTINFSVGNLNEVKKEVEMTTKNLGSGILA